MKSPILKNSGIINAEIEENVTIVRPVNIYGCKIGKDVFIGPFVEIQKEVTVGERTKIQSHSFICELVEIGKDCFIGHGVMFINDKKPKACNEDGSKQQDGDWQLEKTIVKKGASIGSNATILCGIEIGEKQKRILNYLSLYQNTVERTRNNFQILVISHLILITEGMLYLAVLGYL